MMDDEYVMVLRDEEDGSDCPLSVWGFTVVRGEGFKGLRPEKKWKPIVTLDVDQLSGGHRETVLGCDGQNPNLKELLRMWVFQLITMDVTDMRVAPAPP